MGSLYKLVKTSLINSMGINKLLKEGSAEEEYKGFPKIIGMIALGLIISAVPFVYANAMATVLEPYGMLDLVLVAGIVAGSAMTFFTSIFKAQGILFASKDYEMLMSLPIKQSVVLASKMIQILLLNYLFMALCLIPPSIVYFSKVSIEPIFFGYLIVVFLFAPLLPIVAASIIAFILSYISSKVKYKNLVIVVGSLLALALIMIASTNINSIIGAVVENGESIKIGIGKVYPLALYFTNALANLSFVDLLKFALASLIPFIIFLIIFNKAYKNINSKLGENFKSSNYKLTALKTKSPLMALIKKEVKRYLSSPIYILNTSVGLLLVTMASVYILFFGTDMIGQIMAMEGMEIAESMIPLMMIGVITFAVIMSSTTNSTISLEGKNLWILKSLPIAETEIFKAKIAVNLMLLLPIILLNAIILLIGLKLNLVNLLWIIIIPSLYAFIISISGLIINLKFPKLDWVTEVSVVKQGVSVMLTLLLGFIVVLIPVGVLIGFKITNINLYLSGLSVALIAVIFILGTILKTKGKELFNEL